MYPIDSDDIIHLTGRVCQVTRILLITSGNGGVQQGSENELFYWCFLVLFAVEMFYYPRHVKMWLYIHKNYIISWILGR